MMFSRTKKNLKFCILFDPQKVLNRHPQLHVDLLRKLVVCFGVVIIQPFLLAPTTEVLQSKIWSTIIIIFV
jgi:hypothetical protein